MRSYSTREPLKLEVAQKAINQAEEICKKILGDRANYYHAKVLLSLGDLQIESKNFAEGEKTVLSAQIMIGERFSDNHPIMTEFNSHLIEAFNTSSDEGKKAQTVLIAKKNMEISKKYYTEESIYIVKA